MTSQGPSSRPLSFPPGNSDIDENICFTQRKGDAEKDAIFSVTDFEEMMWAEHAGTIGDNAHSMNDMYTENHFAQPVSAMAMAKLAYHFYENSAYPITKDTRLAYACKQSYLIDPTGWGIQPIGMANWPKCSGASTIMV